MTHATSEIIWLRNLLNTLQVPCTCPTTLYCDKQTTTHLAANSIFHKRTKHIEVDCHFIRDHIQSGAITTAHVSTHQQQVDILIKSLGAKTFYDFLSKLGVHNPHFST